MESKEKEDFSRNSYKKKYILRNFYYYSFYAFSFFFSSGLLASSQHIENPKNPTKLSQRKKEDSFSERKHFH